jgi:hypothetical protein
MSSNGDGRNSSLYFRMAALEGYGPNLGTQRTQYDYADYDGLYYLQPNGELVYSRFGFRQRLGYDDANTPRLIRSIEGGEQVVVVGENMKRVNAVSRMVEDAGGTPVTYSPRNWNGISRNSLEANRSWIRYWALEKDAPTIDIGRQSTPRPFGPSHFYGIENRSLNKWGIYTPFNQ